MVVLGELLNFKGGDVMHPAQTPTPLPYSQAAFRTPDMEEDSEATASLLGQPGEFASLPIFFDFLFPPD